MDSEIVVADRPVYGNPDINQVLDAFTEFTGLKLTNTKRQRMFATHLLRNHGLDAIIVMIQFIAFTMNDEFSPRIADLEKLHYKWNDVEIYKGKKLAKLRETARVDLSAL